MNQTQTNRAASSARGPSDGVPVPLTSDSLHDLVSPINQVSSLAELIARKCSGLAGGDAEMLLGLLQESVGRLQNLMAGLRKYTTAVGNESEYRQCDGNTLLAGALATVQAKIDESKAVVTHDPLPELYCDPVQVTCAFAGLIDNAIKFRGDSAPQVHVSSAPQDIAWLFSFRDNGIGIDPRHHERIFSLFKRVHNEEYEGAGIGLAIVKTVVERHGGKVWVESKLGAGSTFFLTLNKSVSASASPSN